MSRAFVWPLEIAWYTEWCDVSTWSTWQMASFCAKDGAACILFAGKRINEPQLDHQRLKLRFEATVFARGMVSIDSW